MSSDPLRPMQDAGPYRVAPPVPRAPAVMRGGVGCFTAIAIVAGIVGYAVLRVRWDEHRAIPAGILAQAMDVRFAQDPALVQAVCGADVATPVPLATNATEITTAGSQRSGTGTANVRITGTSPPCAARVSFDYLSDRTHVGESGARGEIVVQVYNVRRAGSATP